jgi:hypothetical protein
MEKIILFDNESMDAVSVDGFSSESRRCLYSSSRLGGKSVWLFYHVWRSEREGQPARSFCDLNDKQESSITYIKCYGGERLRNNIGITRFNITSPAAFTTKYF